MKKAGILGINGRNLDYIFTQNSRKYYALVDDKLLTKDLAIKAGIAVPELYGVITYQEQLKRLDEILGDRTSFVIKPSQGSGGGGVVVIKGRNRSFYIRSSGRLIGTSDMKYHISNILGGLYALGGLRDQAIIESRVQNIPLFDELAYQGVPDIRLIVYKGVPVMSMLRLPTYASEGRANLHAGGIGVGICIRTGQTTQGVLKNRFILRHSDTGIPLSGIQIPDWQHILTMATKAGAMVKLGYVGVDIVIDEKFGPMLLEVNARPGLAIQIANRAGLKKRLEKIDSDIHTLHSMEAKIAYAMAEFVSPPPVGE